MITYIIIKIHCKRRIQIQDLQGVCTACTRRSRRPHSVATALPKRPRSALSNTLCKRQAAAFVLSMFKINAAAWRSRRLHSVFTAFPQRCWRLHSAHLGDLRLFERCGNAVRAPLLCDRDYSKLPTTPETFLSLKCDFSLIFLSTKSDF